ncbi:ABC transporter permease [Shewanella schlegeliana]|uniref:FtsX-like permease family protein n=1 Tax=Shewanella schlegeliana TaxID=190308 RepID=A0ABS1T0W2_9GAMM|nr:FtsX-like permease family protein [Shewanella schlegeliana]MBL4914423.1 FtsX-like permease family protein [Shewanella schlegeliana]MCL1109353.1 ABC transporter permease [Shewanella schlegeliana]GIU31711.1 ABC transporter permease [Shewanella schlegeliana]
MFQIKPILSMLMRNKSGPLLLLIQIILSVAIVANASFIIAERVGLIARESGIVESEVFDLTVYNFDESIIAHEQNLIDVEIIRNLDGVKAATSSSMTPLSGGGWSSNFSYGTSEEERKDTPNAALYYGDEQMLSTLGVKLIEGRNFYPDEVSSGGPELASLAIVSADFAKDTFGDEPAIGQVMYRGNIGDQPMKIIGVVERLQSAWVDYSNINRSVILNTELGSAFTRFLVRADESAIADLKEAIPAALHKEHPNRVVSGFTTITEHRNSSYRDHELMATVLSMMVVLLLLITSLGLAGMVMFNIERRTKQIGTRRALGAKKRDIVSFFLVENYLLCLVGGLLGGLIAVQLGQQLMTLYSLPKLELIYPIATVAGLLVLTTIAVILPAQKAAKISPATATRSV